MYNSTKQYLKHREMLHYWTWSISPPHCRDSFVSTKYEENGRKKNEKTEQAKKRRRE